MTNTNIELIQMNTGARLTALKTNAVDAVFWFVGLNPGTGESIYYDCPQGVILTECYYKEEASRIVIKK